MKIFCNGRALLFIYANSTLLRETNEFNPPGWGLIRAQVFHRAEKFHPTANPAPQLDRYRRVPHHSHEPLIFVPEYVRVRYFPTSMAAENDLNRPIFFGPVVKYQRGDPSLRRPEHASKPPYPGPLETETTFFVH